MIGNFDEIKNEFEQILLYSQSYPFDINAEPVLRQWETSKEKFITAFGGKTFIRSKEPIKVKMSEESYSRRFDEFICALPPELDNDLMQFIVNNEQGFFNNRVIEPYPEKNIFKGSKLIKSFKKFTNQNVRPIQDLASRYIQEAKIEDYLYLSVDPRDFLTASDNGYNWHSCHALDGDYRAGNLSYMVDDVTIMAYLAPADSANYRGLRPGQVWKNKKWRLYIHTDLDKIYYNRQYPFSSNELLSLVHNKIINMFDLKMTIPMIVGDPTIEEGYPRTFSLNRKKYDSFRIIDYSNYLGYPDLARSSTYRPIISFNLDKYKKYCYSINTEKEDEYFYNLCKIKIGGKALCPCCGEHYLQTTWSFLCSNCIFYYDAEQDFYDKCGGCGRRIYEWEDAYEMNGELYCKRCNEEMSKI